MKIFAYIFARGGSKGIPGKNIKTIGGKPLLEYSINSAMENNLIDRTFVSTDCKQITQVAEKSNITVIDRPKDLALDNSPEWLAWQHAIEWTRKEIEDFDIFVSLPATAPLRSINDVTNCINALTIDCDIVVTASETSRSPWFNMLRENDDGLSELLCKPNSNFTRRQDTPKGYNLCTVAYVSRPDFILDNSNIFDGKVKSVIIPEERSIDIDTMYDFKIAEFLINNDTL